MELLVILLFSQPDPHSSRVANLYSAIVIVAVVTTVATPFALKWTFARRGRQWR